MRSRSRPGLRRSRAIWECPDRRPSGPVFLGKSQTWTGTTGFGPVQTGSQSVWDRTSPTLPNMHLCVQHVSPHCQHASPRLQHASRSLVGPFEYATSTRFCATSTGWSGPMHACRPPWTHLSPSQCVAAPFDVFQCVLTCSDTYCDPYDTPLHPDHAPQPSRPPLDVLHPVPCAPHLRPPPMRPAHPSQPLSWPRCYALNPGTGPDIRSVARR